MPGRVLGESMSIGIVGARGRFGSALRQEFEKAGFDVVLTVSTESTRETGSPDVIVDASHPSALPHTIELCRRHKSSLLVCTSGLDASHHTALEALSEVSTVVRAPNLSMGYWVLTGVLRSALRTATRLEPDIFVHDRHPTTKKDAPSATALALAAIIEAETGEEPLDISSERRGEPVNDHLVKIQLEGEQLLLRHRVAGIHAMARGAVMVAGWIAKSPPGLVEITDVYDELLIRGMA